MTISMGFSGDNKLDDEKDSRDGEVVESGDEHANGGVGIHHHHNFSVEFKPIEHPQEPPSNDQPIKCPMPDPSLLNDGKIWRERFVESMRKRAELSVANDGSQLAAEPLQAVRKRHHSHIVLPLVSSTPEQNNIMKLLHHCNEFKSQ